MSRLWKVMCCEWEKVLCWVLALVLVAAMLSWFGGFGEETRADPARGWTPPAPSLLSGTAFAFLDPQAEWDARSNNPFSFEMEGEEGRRKPRYPWQKTTPAETPKTDPATKPEPAKPPEVKPAVKPTVTPEPAKPPEVKPAVKPEPKTAPKPPPEVRIVRYQGTVTTGSGVALGYVKIIDPKTKVESLRFVQKGSTLQGVRIQDFSERHLEIVDAQGRKRRIGFNEEQKIVLE